jgi:MFS family permease
MCAATAMLMLDIAVINTALPNVAHDLRTDLSGVQWVVDTYTLALAATVLTAGSLADRFGRKRSFCLGSRSSLPPRWRAACRDRSPSSTGRGPSNG